MDYSGNDALALDGQRLLPGTNENGEAIYKTENETFAKIIPMDVNDAGEPSYFEAIGRDGKLYIYGSSSSCRYKGKYSDKTILWLLESATDANGNGTGYNYTLDQNNGAYALSSITTYNQNVPNSQSSVIEFSYTLKPDWQRYLQFLGVPFAGHLIC